jgi:hypothetical protein
MILKIVTFAILIAFALGHGRLISPPGRSSMWRYGYNTPANYDDNQMFCGGFYVSFIAKLTATFAILNSDKNQILPKINRKLL